VKKQFEHGPFDSEVLNRARPLTLAMIRRLPEGLGCLPMY
jgi:antitoxin component HigA of HigAB toxin-antitoxin module